MRDAMKHGGPDDCGIYLDDDLSLAFGHRRLSFLDLSPLGHQPMMDADKNIVIVFNGEIYNFLELRSELQSLGVQFKSSSDTEVIIYAYLHWGKDCFAKFNGMFALALLDKGSNKLLLARDHAGIKPLYYSFANNQLLFASEVRAFKQVNAQWPEQPNWRIYFLTFGHLPEPITTLQDVYPLAKGTCMEVDVHTLQYSTEKFYQQYYQYTINDVATATEKVRETLTKAVERHLISDAPIGLFLSGGLDSSLLTLLAKPFIPDNLHTLSIVFENEKYSEKYYQDIIIKKTGAKHKSYLVTQKDFEDSITDIIAAMDQPSTDGINSYFICKYAKEYGLKAVLSGLGADELFGGYRSFNRSKNIRFLQKLPHFMFHVAGIFPDDKRKKIGFLSINDALGEYLFNRGFFLPHQVASLLGCSLEEVNQAINNMRTQVPDYVKYMASEEKVSYLESNLYMQNQLLKDTDYMSMWHSVEVRVPFLDKELINLVYSINPDIRYNRQQVKYLLIKAFGNELPEEIWKRPKQGFIFPFEQWMKDLTPMDVQTQKFIHMKKGLSNGNIHWSRYWAFLLSQKNTSYQQS